MEDKWWNNYVKKELQKALLAGQEELQVVTDYAKQVAALEITAIQALGKMIKENSGVGEYEMMLREKYDRESL